MHYSLLPTHLNSRSQEFFIGQIKKLEFRSRRYSCFHEFVIICFLQEDCTVVIILNFSVFSVVQSPFVDIKNRPRIPIPSEEDPYTVAGNGGGSSGSSGFGASGSSGEIGRVATAREQLLLQSAQFINKRSEKPPKLPPRDALYNHKVPKVRKLAWNFLFNFINYFLLNSLIMMI